MKKLIVYGAFAFSSIILTLSCQKSKMNPEKSTENSTSYDFRKDNSFIEMFGGNESQSINNAAQRLNITELMEIAKIEDEEVRRTAYSLLNLHERLDYWDYLISYKVNNGEYSENQKQLLMDAKDAFVKPNVFANKNLQEILSVQYLPLISKQFKSAGLTGEDIDNIFVNTSLTNERTLPGSGTKPKCQCNASSFFGCWGCRDNDSCTPTGFGCGFLTFFSCDGSCESIKSIPLN